MSKHRLRTLTLALVAAALLLAACGDDDTESSPTPSSGATTASSSPTPSAAATAVANDAAGPTAEPPSETEPPSANAPPIAVVTILSPVDKDHALSSTYVPPTLASIPGAYMAPGFTGQLRQETVDALVRMLDDAGATGHDVRTSSAYRSYATQESTFNYWVGALGYDAAVKVSAIAGHSEHQLGTTADLSSPAVGWGLNESFGATPEGQWLAANAPDYGFVLSYPAGSEAITGYSYEPWHFRYIGDAEAQAWKASGLTLNQYLLQ